MIAYCVPSYLYDTMYAGKNQSVVPTKEKEHEKIVRYVSISWNIML